MILYINTVLPDEMIIALREGTKVLAQKKIKAPRLQGEKLLPAIEVLLRLQKIKLSALKKIVVANYGGSFTSLRIGVITANALAYALKIPVVAERPTPGDRKKFASYSLVQPIYDRAPDIGKSKKPRL